LADLHRLRRSGDVHFSREGRAPTVGGSLSRVGPAIAHIHEAFSRPLGIRALAKTVSMSPTHFARLFRSAVGCSPHKYVIDHRLLSAITMLREGVLSVEQIAEQCGFGDASGLRKAFKSRLGASPTKWRR
jgi:AraC family transcriptional activator FtrA